MRKSREDFIQQAKEVHGDKYNYDNVEYVNNKTKVTIVCKTCGHTFAMVPTNHLFQKQGCPKCAHRVKRTTADFIKEAQEVHGDKYDYSKAEYVNGDTKICIICPQHGEFWQTPQKHLHGHNCPRCTSSQPIDFQTFKERAIAAHGTEYQYVEASYTKYRNLMTIICPQHGEFQQVAQLHAQGCGCPQCGVMKRAEKTTLSFSEFLERAKAQHGEKYEYSETDYCNYTTKTKIKCPIHGEFWQNPQKHCEEGHGCPICKGVLTSQRQTLTQEEFLRRSIQVHGHRYSYDKAVYNGQETMVTIICPKHGEFTQLPCKHWLGQGCPKCAQSHLENMVEKALSETNIDYITQCGAKKLPFLGMQSLDFFLPQYNIGIECQGIQHFQHIPFFEKKNNAIGTNQDRDRLKYTKCLENNVRIVYFTNLDDKIGQDAWYQDKTFFTQIPNLINYILGYETTNQEKRL